MTNLTDMLSKFVNSNTASTSGSGTLPSNTITNPKVDLKGITTRSGVAYQGPTIPTTSSPPKVVEREPEVTKDTVLPTNNGSTKDVQPPVVQVQSQVPNSKPVVDPVSAPMPNPKPSIPYPSRRNDEKRREKANDQVEKSLENLQDMSFKFVLVDAFDSYAKFCSTLKLNRKQRKIKRCPLKTGRALIDVYEGELTLRVGKEAITFNLDQTSRYSSNYDDMTANRIDVIEMACEEYSQEVLGFSDVIASGNPTPYYDPIISTSSLTLTLSYSDFLLEEVDAFLALEDDPTSPEVDDSYYDPEGDILLLESFLNDDPSPPPNQGNYLPEIRKELKICEAKTDKSSIDEPPEVELKDLPPHLEYAFLEGDNKLPVTIAKDLSIEEKAALIKVLKSHKRAITCKLSDIKGINREFCTHKILMEEDYKPAVQHQRRVNLKIHDVIKKEVEKLLDAGLIYPISDSPWGIHTRFPLSRVDKMLQRCEDTNLCLNWEKSYFMVKEGIVLGYKISKKGIEVDKAKIDVIAKLPHPTTVKVYTDHSALKYLFAKKDSKARLLRWVLPLKSVQFNVIDTKGAKNLAADHLSRLENPYENVLDPKEMIRSVVLQPKKLLTSSKLAIVDPPGDITMPTTPPKRKNFTRMKCLKNFHPKFGENALTYGARNSWGRSRLQEGTNIYSWQSTTCQNGLKRKRSHKRRPSTDNAKITRKRSKPDKHGHGNEKSAKEPEVFINGQHSQSLVNPGQTCEVKTPKYPKQSLIVNP
ncbi:hypothetical protein Tco_0014190 [Tanacetum coccineum]